MCRDALMTNDFEVMTAEMILVDEPDFLAHGGKWLTFGEINGSTVRMHVEGTLDSILGLARNIIAHHTAAH